MKRQGAPGLTASMETPVGYRKRALMPSLTRQDATGSVEVGLPNTAEKRKVRRRIAAHCIAEEPNIFAHRACK
jgi:hypothetical protein